MARGARGCAVRDARTGRGRRGRAASHRRGVRASRRRARGSSKPAVATKLTSDSVAPVELAGKRLRAGADVQPLMVAGSTPSAGRCRTHCEDLRVAAPVHETGGTPPAAIRLRHGQGASEHFSSVRRVAVPLEVTAQHGYGCGPGSSVRVRRLREVRRGRDRAACGSKLIEHRCHPTRCASTRARRTASFASRSARTSGRRSASPSALRR